MFQMSIDEIKRAKADALLEFQEAENRVMNARESAYSLSESLEELAKALGRRDSNRDMMATPPPQLGTIRNMRFESVLNYAEVLKVAEELDNAIQSLYATKQKKDALGLR
jgi:hypothetical protein